MAAAGAQCEQGWDDNNCDNCNAGLPRQLMVLGKRLLLDQGVTTNGRVVLWTQLGGGCEVLPMGGQVVQWMRYQESQV